MLDRTQILREVAWYLLILYVIISSFFNISQYTEVIIYSKLASFFDFNHITFNKSFAGLDFEIWGNALIAFFIPVLFAVYQLRDIKNPIGKNYVELRYHPCHVLEIIFHFFLVSLPISQFFKATFLFYLSWVLFIFYRDYYGLIFRSKETLARHFKDMLKGDKKTERYASINSQIREDIEKYFSLITENAIKKNELDFKDNIIFLSNMINILFEEKRDDYLKIILHEIFLFSGDNHSFDLKQRREIFFIWYHIFFLLKEAREKDWEDLYEPTFQVLFSNLKNQFFLNCILHGERAMLGKFFKDKKTNPEFFKFYLKTLGKQIVLYSCDSKKEEFVDFCINLLEDMKKDQERNNENYKLFSEEVMLVAILLEHKYGNGNIEIGKNFKERVFNLVDKTPNNFLEIIKSSYRSFYVISAFDYGLANTVDERGNINVHRWSRRVLMVNFIVAFVRNFGGDDVFPTENELLDFDILLILSDVYNELQKDGQT